MDLIIIIILTAVLAPLVIFASEPLRIALGLLFVLFFPGYTLTAALFPRKDDLGTIERVALSFGLSIVVVPLTGLILNYAWEISVYSVLFFITGFIMIASVIAAYRRYRLPRGQRFEPHFHISLPRWGQEGRLDRALSGALLLAIIAAIGMLASGGELKGEDRLTAGEVKAIRERLRRLGYLKEGE